MNENSYRQRVRTLLESLSPDVLVFVSKLHSVKKHGDYVYFRVCAHRFMSELAVEMCYVTRIGKDYGEIDCVSSALCPNDVYKFPRDLDPELWGEDPANRMQLIFEEVIRWLTGIVQISLLGMKSFAGEPESYRLFSLDGDGWIDSKFYH